MAGRKKIRRRSKRQQELFQTIIFFLTTILSIAGLIIYLWIYTEIDETLMALDLQNQMTKELANSVKELKIDIAQLERVDRLTTVARKELGMVVSQPETLVIYIDPDLLVENLD
ncbi:MAG: hypothetical protein ACE5D2_03210 [Fidelibacterota bacterium]